MVMNILMVAGEASADGHGALLLQALRERHPDIRCFGVGGTKLEAQGMEIVVNARHLNIVGILDWFSQVRGVIGAFTKLLALAKREKPDVAVLLDLPDFNLTLAKRLHRLGIPVVYYISPQVWAW